MSHCRGGDRGVRRIQENMVQGKDLEVGKMKDVTWNMIILSILGTPKRNKK